MPYQTANNKGTGDILKKGAAEYQSWMQLTQSQANTIKGLEGANYATSSDPLAERYAQLVYVINQSAGGAATSAIADGVDDTLFATVADLTNSNPLATMIVDANGDQITSFGGSSIKILGDDNTTEATVADLTNSNALTVQIVDANGDQITTFGGGATKLLGDDDATNATVRDYTNSNPLAVSLTDTNGDALTSLSGAAEGTPDAVAAAKVVQLGGIAETGTPTAVADGDAVAAWFDAYGRQILAGYNVALQALDVNLISDSLTSKLGPSTNLSAVTANTTGSSIDISSYHNVTVHLTSSSTTVGATFSIQSSLDGTNWATIDSEVINTDDTIEYSYMGVAYNYIRTVISNRTDGTFTSVVYAGN